MKIEKIRFRNLASLRGEWTIDLTGKVFSDAGIFALSGPVGSGKTTVFDAVRLALFGRTSRLERVNQNDNEIMTRGTKECFAELIFSNEKGRFLCRWSQHRANRTDNLQKADHKLSEYRDDSGEAVILTSKLEETRERIRELIQMDFNHFSRAMILPQGQFASFLQAGSDERAPILEQLTGTGIYTEISKKVHEKCRELETELSAMEASAAGIEVLAPEQSAELKQLIAEHQETVRAIKTEYDAKAGLLRSENELILEKAGLEKLQFELQNAVREDSEAGLAAKEAEKSLVDAKNEFALLLPLLLRVRELDTKIELETAHALQLRKEFSARSARNAVDTRTLAENEGKLRLRNEKLLQLRAFLKDNAVDSSLANELGSLELLFAREKEIRKSIALADKTQKEKNAESEHRKKTLETLAADLKTAESERLAAELLLNEKKNAEEKLLGKDSSISKFYAELELLRKKADALEDIRALLQNERTMLDDLKKKKEFSERNSENKKQNAELLSLKLELKKQVAEKLALMEQQRLAEAKIASYEKDRKALRDNAPCPLCGSTQHPYAEQLPQTISPDAFSAVHGELEKIAKEISQLEKNAAGFEIHTETAAKEIAILDSSLNSLRSALARCDLNAFELNPDSPELMDELSAKLASFGEQVTRNETLAALIEQNSREKTDAENGRQLAETKLQQGAASLERAQLELNSTAQLLVQLDEERKVKQNELDSVRDTLNSMLEKYALASDSPDVLPILKKRSFLYEENRREEHSLRLEIVRLSADNASETERLRKETAELTIQKEAVDSAQTALEIQKKSRFELFASRVPAEEERKANEKINIAGKKVESELAKSRLCSDQVKILRTRQSETQARIVKYETLIQEQPGERQEIPELEKELLRLDSLRQEKSRIIGEYSARLETSEKNRERASLLLAEMENKRAVRLKWEYLNDLIGSADGKKYRSFVQSLTLETLIENANEQLARFSDRYTLTVDSETGLEFNVTDAYRGNEVRSTRNLSGGETFIVSLALALGLSRMARNKVRIDTLFLDEGFGTLDENTLQHALEQLAGLKQSGKLIGIITHAHGIDDAVPVVLHFENHSGHSTISGPGVSGE